MILAEKEKIRTASEDVFLKEMMEEDQFNIITDIDPTHIVIDDAEHYDHPTSIFDPDTDYNDYDEDEYYSDDPNY